MFGNSLTEVCAPPVGVQLGRGLYNAQRLLTNRTQPRSQKIREER